MIEFYLKLKNILEISIMYKFQYNIFLKFYYIKFQKRDAWLVLNFIQYCTHFLVLLPLYESFMHIYE